MIEKKKSIFDLLFWSVWVGIWVSLYIYLFFARPETPNDIKVLMFMLTAIMQNIIITLKNFFIAIDLYTYFCITDEKKK